MQKYNIRYSNPKEESKTELIGHAVLSYSRQVMAGYVQKGRKIAE